MSLLRLCGIGCGRWAGTRPAPTLDTVSYHGLGSFSRMYFEVGVCDRDLVSVMRAPLSYPGVT